MNDKITFMKVVSCSSISSPSSMTDLGLTLYLLSLVLCLLVLFMWMTSSRSWIRELGRKVRHPTPCSIIVIDVDVSYLNLVTWSDVFRPTFNKKTAYLHHFQNIWFASIPVISKILEFDKTISYVVNSFFQRYHDNLRCL